MLFIKSGIRGLDFGSAASVSGSRIQGLRVQGLGFRVYDLGFRAWGLGDLGLGFQVSRLSSYYSKGFGGD